LCLGWGWIEYMMVRQYGWWTSCTHEIEHEMSWNCFKWDGEGTAWWDSGDDLSNIQYKSNWNCLNESPLYNE
jgi:hypothetical protein